MISLSTNDREGLAGSKLLEQELWYAAATASRHEKTVAEQMQRRGVEYFLPLYDTVHRWKNGRHHLQLPLFPGYIFVRIALRERLRVLEIPGCARLVGFGGLPFPVEDAEIEAMRSALSSALKVEPYPYLTAGARIEVCRGPLQGMTGFLLRRHGSCRVVLSVDLIMSSMVVEVDAADVVPRKGPSKQSTAGEAPRRDQPRVYA
jgi:transcription antitermination factor NusG